MEKITVEIGMQKNPAGSARSVNRGCGPDISWLSRTLRISYKRAQRLIERMKADGYVPVIMDHEQLARYVALRRMQSLEEGGYYWRWPKVTDYEEDQEPVCRDQPEEIRPGRRITPDRC